MRTVLKLSLLLVSAVWGAATFDWPAAGSSEKPAMTSATSGTEWRHTAAGWERSTDWTVKRRLEELTAQQPRTLHPLLLADLEILLAVGSLAIFSSRRG